MAEKKITDSPVSIKRIAVAARPAGMSILRQCGLLELARSTFYYQPLGENPYNPALMRRIDEQFTKRPFYGVPRMTAWLRATGYPYATVPNARGNLGAYFQFYNEERLHEALDYRTPHEMYFGTRSALAPASEAVV